jgi:hypothetical protein
MTSSIPRRTGRHRPQTVAARSVAHTERADGLEVPVRCYVLYEGWVVLWQPLDDDGLIAYIGRIWRRASRRPL